MNKGIKIQKMKRCHNFFLADEPLCAIFFNKDRTIGISKISYKNDGKIYYSFLSGDDEARVLNLLGFNNFTDVESYAKNNLKIFTDFKKNVSRTVKYWTDNKSVNNIDDEGIYTKIYFTDGSYISYSDKYISFNDLVICSIYDNYKKIIDSIKYFSKDQVNVF